MVSIPYCRTIGRITGLTLLLICACLSLVACNTGGTDTPAPTAQAGFLASVKTTDQQFGIQFRVTPNRLGLNTFTLNVEDEQLNKSASGLQAQITTIMLDMNMGTDQVNLQPDGSGQYSAQGSLSMPGHWDIRIFLRTPDSRVHQATVKLDVQS